MSFKSDADPDGKFRKLFTNMIIYKDDVYTVNANIQCFDYIILKVSTMEGFHTKTLECSEIYHTESFVSKMSSLVKNVKFTKDYDQLASEIIDPI